MQQSAKKQKNPEKDAARINDNIRALSTYLKHFSNSKFLVLETPKLIYVHGEVSISAYPDLYVDDGSKKKLIKLGFSEKKPHEDLIQIMLKVMHEAASASSVSVFPADVVYLDITRHNQYSGKKLNKQMKKNIDAACETIQDIWPGLKQ